MRSILLWYLQKCRVADFEKRVTLSTKGHSPDMLSELFRPLLPGHHAIGQQVRVWNPADLIRVLLMVASEIGGAPAMKGRAHILRRADTHGEDNKEDNRVAVV